MDHLSIVIRAISVTAFQTKEATGGRGTDQGWAEEFSAIPVAELKEPCEAL